tara:strand:- start:192 stop:764 length:573 start_codon:yes stop_codon:yes gene_type:complete
MANITETCYFTFGRFNPPTIGHKKLLDQLVYEAGADDYLIFPTKSLDKKKNPLEFKIKVKWMKKSFPDYADNIIDNIECCRTIVATCQHMMMLGYTRIVMVVGSDRVEVFDRIIGDNNRKPDEFSFDTYEVKSAGQRDPDADGATGMSASKLRDFAKDAKCTEFMEGCTDKLSTGEKIALMTDVRNGMGL